MDKVLIKPKEIEVKTKGGIIMPEQTREKEKHAQVEGVLVAVGALSTSSDSNAANWHRSNRRWISARNCFVLSSVFHSFASSQCIP